MTTVRIERSPRRILAGLSYFGDPFHASAGWTEENEIGRLWTRLGQYLALEECPYPPPAESFEVCVQNHTSPVTGEFEVFVGFEVADATAVPVELCVKVLPAADYAVLTLRGDQLRGEEAAVDEWLAATGHERVLPVEIQRYDERFLGVDRLEESELDVLVPVRPREPERTGPPE
ncbi:MAG: GyrI-like domain-containing protein [Actinomycetales bacterium]|nr:GyrI-like domain-containing protein [Actinomycetales bacterium]